MSYDILNDIRFRNAYEKGNGSLLSDYMDRAMQHAHYELIEDGTYFATIPGFEGLWANAKSEQACHKELREVLEGWILLGIAHHEPLPEIDGMKLEVGKAV